MVDGRHLRRCRKRMLKHCLIKSGFRQYSRYIIWVWRLTHKPVLRRLSQYGGLTSKTINRGTTGLSELDLQPDELSYHHRRIICLNRVTICYASNKSIRVRCKAGVSQNASIPIIVSKVNLVPARSTEHRTDIANPDEFTGRKPVGDV
jgi:hypothetical protein